MALERMNAQDLLGLLPEGSLLSACEPDQLDDLLSRSKVEFVPRREILIHQGDPGDSAVILVTGTARVNMVSANGREIVLDYLGPGTVIGEIALLDGGERTATVTMVEDGSIMRLTRSECEDFIASNPTVALRMLQEMARRLRQMNLTVESDRAFSAGPRLARYLQRLTDEEAASLVAFLESMTGEVPEEALEEGHELYRVFFYHEGVASGSGFAQAPQDESSAVERWASLSEQHGTELVLCIASAIKRGFLDNAEAERYAQPSTNIHPAYMVSGLGQLIDASARSDRLITFGC